MIRRWSGRRSASPDDPAEHDPAEHDPADDRRSLIDLVIYAYDRTTSTGIRARLAEGLAAVGVTAVQPDGEPFDPGRHEAGGTEPTDDPALHDRIAETERPGFVDGEHVIREPIVVVYRRR